MLSDRFTDDTTRRGHVIPCSTCPLTNNDTPIHEEHLMCAECMEAAIELALEHIHNIALQHGIATQLQTKLIEDFVDFAKNEQNVNQFVWGGSR